METPTVAQDGDGVGLDSLKGDAQKHAEDAKNHAISFLHCSRYCFCTKCAWENPVDENALFVIWALMKKILIIG